VFNDNKLNGENNQPPRREWKKKGAFAGRVEVALLKRRVNPDIIKLLCEGVILSIENNLVFSLYTDKSAIVFNPKNLQSVQGDNKLKFASLKNFIKAIEMTLLTHHSIYVDQDEPPRKIILLND
jgi:hypothetical protein